MMNEIEKLKFKLDLLEQWFKENPKLPEEIDRLLLKRFLKAMYGDVEETKKIIELNYTIRNKNPHIFMDRDPDAESVQIYREATDLVILPGLTADRHKVILFRLVDLEPSKLNSVEELKIYFMLADSRFTMPDIILGNTKQTEATGISDDMDDTADGEVQIVDIGGYTMGHLARYSIFALRVYMKFLQEAFPMRLHGIHMVNCPSYLDKMVTFFRPFINENVYKLMHFHTEGLESLYEFVPQNMLPIEYGGTAGTMDELKSQATRILRDKRDYIMDYRQWKVEPPKRNRWSWF